MVEGFFELDEDEADHYRNIPDDVERQMDMSNGAAALALTGLSAVERRYATNEPQALVMLLLVKSAQNIRFAWYGLRLGYYSGAAATLRSALESLLYATLFDAAPHEIAEWLRNERSSMPAWKLNQFRSRQKKRALKALMKLESEPWVINPELDRFAKDANERIHVTLTGLSDEFGVEVGHLVPDTFWEAFEAAGKNLEKALRLHMSMTKSANDNGEPNTRIDQADDDLVTFPIGCHYRERKLGDLTSFAFYIAHRVLDLTEDAFEVSDLSFVEGYESWHAELKNH